MEEISRGGAESAEILERIKRGCYELFILRGLRVSACKTLDPTRCAGRSHAGSRGDAEFAESNAFNPNSLLRGLRASACKALHPTRPARAIVVGGGVGLPSDAGCWSVHGYNGDMALAPKDPTRWPVHIGHLHDADAGRRDMAYWRSCSPAQRMAELDRLREEHDGPQPRLARVAVVIERKPR